MLLWLPGAAVRCVCTATRRQPLQPRWARVTNQPRGQALFCCSLPLLLPEVVQGEHLLVRAPRQAGGSSDTTGNGVIPLRSATVEGSGLVDGVDAGRWVAGPAATAVRWAARMVWLAAPCRMEATLSQPLSQPLSLAIVLTWQVTSVAPLCVLQRACG